MSEKWISAGGVVLEKLEEPYKVYVVKPSNNYGPWCFPKGRVDGKDSLQTTAQREVLEESGVPAEFVDGGNLGTGVGSYSITHYYLMVQSGPVGEHDFETEEVRLVTFEQAKKLFSSMGNSRDITILERAELFLKNFDKKQNEVYHRSLMSLLKEFKEESKDEIFNKYAFANNRIDNVPKELDSKIENEIYKALALHISENIQMSKKISNILIDILSRGLYSDVIKEPNEFEVFRGMNVSREWLSNVLKIKQWDLSEKGDKEINFIFIPKEEKGSSSWSDFETAQEFAFGYQEGGESRTVKDFDIVLIAKVHKNKNKFLSCIDGLYKVKPISKYSGENEYIGLGEIDVSGIYWYKSRGK